MLRTLSLTLLSLLLCLSPARAAGKVTLPSLLDQMTNLEALAEFPALPAAPRQFSSYDRASESPKAGDSWFANSDRGFTLYDGVVEKKTPYFKDGPMQGRGPDGYFPAGTKVGLAPNRRRIGEYVWAYATGPDGRAVDGK